ncbi:MAG: caspase family protein [Deltaproteobacteria bacterium]|nr:caspase family protein [Deltaproteobacteria bacterium]
MSAKIFRVGFPWFLLWLLTCMTSGGVVAAADDFVAGAPARGQQTAARSADVGTRYVLAVGVCKFADTRIAPLKYCVADAKSLAEYFAKDGVTPQNIRLLLDEDATRERLLAELRRLAGELAPADSLFFFYSSHGAGDAAGRTYFITFDAVLDQLAESALPMQELKAEIEKIRCRNVVMMVDTCHSGGVKSLQRPDEKAFDQLVRSADKTTRIAILTSSRTHETSLESEQWRHGAFTYFMLEGLAGASDDFPRDGEVSVTELFDYVMVAVPRATERAQHPSGKFSYNWPGKKEEAVKVGRANGGGQPYQGQNLAPGADPGQDRGAGSSGATGGPGWRPVVE